MTGVPSESKLMVLQTDYSGYAIAYNCKYDEKTKIHEGTSLKPY